MFILGWGLSTFPDYMCYFLQPGSGWNVGLYDSEEFDALCTDFFDETDMETAQQISYELQNILAEDLPYIYSYKGNCLKDLQRYDDAIEVLKRGCEEDDEREDLHNLLGFCYFKKEEYQTAISHFERAVHLNPASAMDYANLGVNHNRLGNRQEAIRFFTLALTLDPSIDFARAQLEELSHGQEN